ncbi:hypothetical protein EB821_00630 [Candidatus Marinimicrobia bacterium PRS2]|nr:hypothetical protein EB821_00630 [Candidatus Marinimicrobia bacterium PRS2]
MSISTVFYLITHSIPCFFIFDFLQFFSFFFYEFHWFFHFFLHIHFVILSPQRHRGTEVY